MKIALISPKGPLYRHRGGIFGKSLRYAPLTLTTLASLVPEGAPPPWSPALREEVRARLVVGVLEDHHPVHAPRSTDAVHHSVPRLEGEWRPAEVEPVRLSDDLQVGLGLGDAALTFTELGERIDDCDAGSGINGWERRCWLPPEGRCQA